MEHNASDEELAFSALAEEENEDTDRTRDALDAWSDLLNVVGVCAAAGLGPSDVTQCALKLGRVRGSMVAMASAARYQEDTKGHRYDPVRDLRRWGAALSLVWCAMLLVSFVTSMVYPHPVSWLNGLNLMSDVIMFVRVFLDVSIQWGEWDALSRDKQQGIVDPKAYAALQRLSGIGEDALGNLLWLVVYGLLSVMVPAATMATVVLPWLAVSTFLIRAVGSMHRLRALHRCMQDPELAPSERQHLLQERSRECSRLVINVGLGVLLSGVLGLAAVSGVSVIPGMVIMALSCLGVRVLWTVACMARSRVERYVPSIKRKEMP